MIVITNKIIDVEPNVKNKHIESVKKVLCGL